MLNPICPHFAEYCWDQHVRPVLEKSKNLTKAPAKRLNNQGWPVAEKQFESLKRRMYEYMKAVKSNVRLA